MLCMKCIVYIYICSLSGTGEDDNKNIKALSSIGWRLYCDIYFNGDFRGIVYLIISPIGKHDFSFLI